MPRIDVLGKPGFRHGVIPATKLPTYPVLGNPASGIEVFPETRIAPVLLHQDREMLPPSHRTGYERYSPSFREKLFGKSGLGLKSRPHRLPREGKKSYLVLLGPQYLPLQRPPANYQTVSEGLFPETHRHKKSRGC